MIRPAAADDAAALGHLHIDVWENAYFGLMLAGVFEERRATIPERIARWHQQLTHSPARTSVAEYAGGLAGFISVGPPRADDVDVDEELYGPVHARLLVGLGTRARAAHLGTGATTRLPLGAAGQRSPDRVLPQAWLYRRRGSPNGSVRPRTAYDSSLSRPTAQKLQHLVGGETRGVKPERGSGALYFHYPVTVLTRLGVLGRVAATDT